MSLLAWLLLAGLVSRGLLRANNYDVTGFENPQCGKYVGPWVRRFLILPRTTGWIIGMGWERKVVYGVSFDSAIVVYEVQRHKPWR